MGKSIIEKDSVRHASKVFLTGNQRTKNRIIDVMFRDQPSLLEFLQYLDRAINKEPIKEVILQLMSIFYGSLVHQKIKLNKISINDLTNSLGQSAEMKHYFHNPQFDFDRDSFKTFVDGYSQKEILNYTYFAIDNQFRNYIESENDALFIFYIMKIFGEAIDKNIRK